jgi:hypothetical protein
MDRIQILREIRNLTIEKVELDFQNLREKEDFSGISTIGNKVVDYFTEIERMNTKGNKNISFFELFSRRDEYRNKKYIQNMLDYYETDDVKTWKNIYRLYFNSIQIFRPLIAKGIYAKFSPKCVLDPTMGWGGRLVGACALNVPHYIGIDLNRNLIEPYEAMTKFLSNHSTTKIELFWGDCLTFDYSKIEYDMVLTSPPYYNIENYSFQERRTKQEWNENFYKPLVLNTYQYLREGGDFCLNVNEEIYHYILSFFREPEEKIEYPKSNRNNGSKKEYIYIWKKLPK